jgi:hypothetical protein
MREKSWAGKTASAISLLILLEAGSSIRAQPPEPVSSEYARAIYTTIQRHWEAESFSSEITPGSDCAARITQIPGGDVVAVDILPDCDFNKAGRAAIVNAVHRSKPFPYSGFESVFQARIKFVFHAASVKDRQAFTAAKASEQVAAKKRDDSDRLWEVNVGTQLRRDEYSQQCSFHLGWELSSLRLRHSSSVIVTVDRFGKVQAVTDLRNKAVDEPLTAALVGASPCKPVPAELGIGEGTFKVGPIIFRPRKD